MNILIILSNFLLRTMGHTYVKARFFNAVDYARYIEGKLKIEEVRKIEVNALIDTGATFPALPE